MNKPKNLTNNIIKPNIHAAYVMPNKIIIGYIHHSVNKLNGKKVINDKPKPKINKTINKIINYLCLAWKLTPIVLGPQ